MKRIRTLATLAVASTWLLACGSNASSANTPSTHAASPSIDVGSGESSQPEEHRAVPSDAVPSTSSETAAPAPTSKIPGPEPSSASNTGRFVELDVSALPVADYPPYLKLSDAPAALPQGAQNPLKRKPAKLFKSGRIGRSWISVSDEPLTRLQIGTVKLAGYARATTHVVCRDDFDKWVGAGSVSQKMPPIGPNKSQSPTVTYPGIHPARWEVLSRDKGGKVRLTVTDAWFDGDRCEAAIHKVTIIEPRALIDGQVYAFRGQCADCKNKSVITWLMPNTTFSSRYGKGHDKGPFALLRMPQKVHMGGTFVGMASASGLRSWTHALGGVGDPLSKSQRGLIGLEIVWDRARKSHSVFAHGSVTP